MGTNLPAHLRLFFNDMRYISLRFTYLLTYHNLPTSSFNFRTIVLRLMKLESLTRHETSSTVCLRMCSDGYSICYSIETLDFNLLTPNCEAFISVP